MDIHAFLLLVVMVGGQEKWDPKKPRSVVVEVLKDTEVDANEECAARPCGAAAALRLKKGQRFETLEDRGEGSCRIRFEKRVYDVRSCTWMGGFRDTQEDVFRIIPRRVVVPAKKK